jgi:hypothetical protein
VVGCDGQPASTQKPLGIVILSRPLLAAKDLGPPCEAACPERIVNTAASSASHPRGMFAISAFQAAQPRKPLAVNKVSLNWRADHPSKNELEWRELGRFSKLAMFDAILYIRVRCIDEPV